ncbi:MAG: pyridoxal phosphate-dependent aminotransferase [Gemmatimonadales bacterium]
MTAVLTPSNPVATQASYSVPRPPFPIDLHLDGNEGPPPPPSLLARAVRDGEVLRRYPSTKEFEAKLARRAGVAPDRMLVTAGADDALDRLCRTMLAGGREIVLPVPTFEMLDRYARAAGGMVVEVEWGNRPWPREEVIARLSARTGIVAVVSPNNPTGGVVSADDLRAVSEAAPHATVLVDMAYAEFGDGRLTDLARDLPNTVVARTFSKAWGLAGLRVGYAIGPAEVIGWLRSVGAPYAVSGLSLAVAARWMEEGTATMEAFVAEVRAERTELEAFLSDAGIAVQPSAANFVFARFRDATTVLNGLAQRGIAVRAFPSDARLQNALRITLPGTRPAFDRLRRGLQEVL